MSLSWPWALTALLAVPLLLTARWWFNRRRKRTAVTVSSIALIRAALPGRTAWRRRVPVWLFLAGLVALAGGVTRPQASVAVPSNDTTILLAIDVSGSMCNTDIAPNRLAVAVDAARGFVESQDGDTRIGLVAFSGIAGLLVPPTTDKQPLLEAIDNLKTARGTAIGQAILTSVDAIAEINPEVAKTGVDLGAPPDGLPVDYQPDTIVVLTDGSNTTGVDPVTAAGQAAARRLRVYTIGFGTTNPQQMVCTAQQVSGDSAFGGGGFGGGGFGGGRGGGNREIDEDALTQVADLTGGRYFKAEDAEQLTDVLGDLPREFALTKQNVEVTVWFLLLGTLLAISGIGLSLWWNRGPATRRPTPAGHPSALPNRPAAGYPSTDPSAAGHPSATGHAPPLSRPSATGYLSATGHLPADRRPSAAGHPPAGPRPSAAGHPPADPRP
ncbi:VWA domain-containing protein [Actinoplanes sp. NEAU-A12]|uniref:VWA domain-containing protein n=1 Tax=Actinoplanes sandaracinus TaxID=3045177 RepID=A0ABT6WNZ6_9ACTN|nr:VWA domain-containing protein [Actinoplanes sandaracinus]MDI6101375.1 VWA domain-containing protein [Actinoplanes sandaracinus]